MITFILSKVIHLIQVLTLTMTTWIIVHGVIHTHTVQQLNRSWRGFPCAQCVFIPLWFPLWYTCVSVPPSLCPAVIEPIPMGEAAKDYLGRFVSPTLLSGLTELCKQKPVDPFVSIRVAWEMWAFKYALWTLVHVTFAFFLLNQLIQLFVFFFLPKTWLADWLVRNNPNKPQIFDGATGEDAA